MDVPSEMVERVARVINAAPFSREPGSGHGPGECANCDEERAQACATARAAIEAMMEPTAAMVTAGHDTMEHALDEIVHDPVVPLIWQAMLSEALSPSLKEQEEGN